LGVGISKAELATGKFEDIQQKLTTLFAGQASSAAESYAGQMAKLQVAANNAKETIGEGLVDALKLLSGDTSIDQLNTGLEQTSLYIADIIRGIGVFIQKLKEIPVAGKAFQLPLDAYVQAIPVIGAYISILANMGSEMRLLNNQAGRAFTGGSGGPSRDFVKEREAKAAAAKLKADKLSASNKIKADKLAAANKAKLDKAAAVFEIQKIQIAAALKGKISEEEKTRLLLMQAIADEDADKAEKLTKKLEEIQAKNAKIAADLLAIGEAKDPFATWAGSLALALLELGKFNKGIKDIPGLVPGVNFNPAQNADRNYDTKTAAAAAAAAAAALAAAAGGAGTGGGTSIFAEDDTIDEILAKVENAAAAAAEAAEAAAASVAETQVAVDALAQFGTNSMPAAGMNFNPYQSRDRNYDAGYSNQAPSITINIEGNVLDGDDFTNKVNDALLNANRQGLPRIAAGSLLELP
jgi:hypothetical protein